MSQAISSMMRKPVWSVGMDDTLAQVEALLAERALSWVPVLEPGGGQVVGVISATDLLPFHARPGETGRMHAWQLCTYKPIMVGPQRPVREVAALMLEHGIHHVVVVEGNAIAGVVSSLDFVRQFVHDADRQRGGEPQPGGPHAPHVPI